MTTPLEAELHQNRVNEIADNMDFYQSLLAESDVEGIPVLSEMMKAVVHNPTKLAYYLVPKPNLSTYGLILNVLKLPIDQKIMSKENKTALMEIAVDDAVQNKDLMSLVFLTKGEAADLDLPEYGSEFAAEIFIDEAEKSNWHLAREIATHVLENHLLMFKDGLDADDYHAWLEMEEAGFRQHAWQLLDQERIGRGKTSPAELWDLFYELDKHTGDERYETTIWQQTRQELAQSFIDKQIGTGNPLLINQIVKIAEDAMLDISQHDIIRQLFEKNTQIAVNWFNSIFNKLSRKGLIMENTDEVPVKSGKMSTEESLKHLAEVGKDTLKRLGQEQPRDQIVTRSEEPVNLGEAFQATKSVASEPVADPVATSQAPKEEVKLGAAFQE